MNNNTEAFTLLVKKLATPISLQESELQEVLHPNSVEIAKFTLKGAADLLKTEDHNSNFLDFIKVLRDSTVARKEVMIILEGHIRNMNFNDTWILVLENLSARSPTDLTVKK